MAMDNTQSRFIQCVNDAYEKAVGAESYGDTMEFFDEDGCVVMTATEQGANTVLFKFPGQGDEYQYQTQEDAEE